VKLGHWQLLALMLLPAPLALTGTAAAMDRGHAASVVLPAVLYLLLVAHLVRRAAAHRGRTPRSPRRPDHVPAQSEQTEPAPAGRR
jgi:hypothetical protein